MTRGRALLTRDSLLVLVTLVGGLVLYFKRRSVSTYSAPAPFQHHEQGHTAEKGTHGDVDVAGNPVAPH